MTTPLGVLNRSDSAVPNQQLFQRFCKIFNKFFVLFPLSVSTIEILTIYVIYIDSATYILLYVICTYVKENLYACIQETYHGWKNLWVSISHDWNMPLTFEGIDVIKSWLSPILWQEKHRHCWDGTTDNKEEAEYTKVFSKLPSWSQCTTFSFFHNGYQETNVE